MIGKENPNKGSYDTLALLLTQANRVGIIYVLSYYTYYSLQKTWHFGYFTYIKNSFYLWAFQDYCNICMLTYLTLTTNRKNEVQT